MIRNSINRKIVRLLGIRTNHARTTVIDTTTNCTAKYAVCQNLHPDHYKGKDNVQLYAGRKALYVAPGQYHARF